MMIVNVYFKPFNHTCSFLQQGHDGQTSGWLSTPFLWLSEDILTATPSVNFQPTQ